jgi:hypothetical protein
MLNVCDGFLHTKRFMIRCIKSIEDGFNENDTAVSKCHEDSAAENGTGKLYVTRVGFFIPEISK